MPHLAHTNDLSTAGLERFDAIIDVRSPSEFAEDHLPGAINLPVLDDQERARVGTHYTQVSVFEARRMGAALVSRNIARHLETALADQPKQFRPLIYCWRGGMRSQSMALVLASVGWKPVLIEGGYRTWRRQVVEAQETLQLPRLVVLDGQTGTAKTAILQALGQAGEQIIDLEGLAHHRGSIFGDFPDATQPSQKAFETALFTIIRDLDPDRPVYVEAESRQVGKRRVPPGLWAAMQTAPHLVIHAPVAARAEYLVSAYPDLLADGSKLTEAINGLRQFHAKLQIEDWLSRAESGDWTALAAELVTEHYDPAYDRARKRQAPPQPEHVIMLERLDRAGLDQAVTRIRAKTLF